MANIVTIVPQFTTGKPELVSQLLAAKEASGKTFTQIGQEIGRTNLYTTQLFFNQVGRSTMLMSRRPSVHTGVNQAMGRRGRPVTWNAASAQQQSALSANGSAA